MTDTRRPVRSGALFRAVLVCLLLGLAVGAVLYAVSGKPLPALVERYFYGASDPSSSSAPSPAKEAPAPSTPVGSAPGASVPDRATGNNLPSPPASSPASPSASLPPWTPPVQTDPSGPTYPADPIGPADPSGPAPDPEPAPGPAPEGNAPSGGSFPGGGQNGSDAVPQAAEHAPSPEPGNAAALADGGTEQDRTVHGREPEVVRYGRAHPVEGKGSVVRGRIEQGAPVGRVFDDPVVGSAFITDLASFLTDNYWPRGTHPMARNTGVTTAGLRWANMRYGAGLTAFGLNTEDPVSGRRRLLDYAFSPGMIRGLYRLHAGSFLAALEKAARSRITERGPLDETQCAEMFAIYARMAKGLSGCIRAYQRTPGIRSLVASYAEASEKAAQDYLQYAEAMEAAPVAKSRAAERYRISVTLREQQKAHLAAAMRRGGDTGGLDADSLVYAALWLHRRGEGRNAALTAAAEVCAACSERLFELSRRHGGRSAR